MRELRDTTRRQIIEHDVFAFKGAFEIRTTFARHHKFLCACACVRKREIWKKAHISAVSLSFEVIKVISLGKFSSAEEVDISFNSETKSPLVFFFGKETMETLVYGMFYFGKVRDK